MTTMRDAVTRVARTLGVVRAGREPTTHDATDLLAHMQGVIDRLPHFRNGPWRDVLLTSDADYVPKDGQRVSPEGFDPVITLPTTYSRGGGSRVQRDLSRVHVIGDGIYIWSSTLGAWNKADNLKMGDPFPFGAEDLPGIVAMTAILAAPEYGAEISPATASVASGATASLRSRFYRPTRSMADDCCEPADGCFRDYR